MERRADFRAGANLTTEIRRCCCDPAVHECRYVTLIALLNMNNSAVQKIYIFPYMSRMGE